MKTRFFSLLALVSLVVTNGALLADKPLGKQEIKHVDAKKAGELWKAHKDNEGFIVLDVRTPSENAEKRIPNAKNLDVQAKDFAAKANKLDKERTYLVHCRSGGRSQTALKILKKLGFLKIYHMDGGLMAWEKEGLKVEKGE